MRLEARVPTLGRRVRVNADSVVGLSVPRSIEGEVIAVRPFTGTKPLQIVVKLDGKPERHINLFMSDYGVTWWY